MSQLFFDEESIYEISKLYLEGESTDEDDAPAKT